MIQLVSQKRPEHQKYNTFYFILDNQRFNLTAHDMRSTLVNAVLENHRSQTTPGTPMSLVTSPSSSIPMRSPIHTVLPYFKKGVKREASSYSTLKDERYFDKFHRDLFIAAKSLDVSEILDPTLTPGPSPEEKKLFEGKQVFMYKVFNETLSTDMGRTEVRKYLKTIDAQAVWKEYSENMTTAFKGASEKRKLTQYVTNTVLDSQFRGTSQQFVLHFNEQFRRLDELTDLGEKMPESIKMALLQNAVNDIPQLSIVETLDEYTSTTSGTGSCTKHTYTSYYNLLINACVWYDATNTSTPSKRRNVYTAAGAPDLNAIEEAHEAHFSQDIDTPSDDFYLVHQAKQGKPPPTPLSGVQRNHPRKPTPSTPKKPFKNMMVLYMSLLKFISSSAQKLLLPSRNTTLRPSTNLPRKGVFMSLTLLAMRHPHQRIQHMRNKLTLTNLMMHLPMRLTQLWTTSTVNITRKKI